MARITNVDSTDIYRMLVTRLWPGGEQRQTAYGPHDTLSCARDYNARYKYPARLERQQLVAFNAFGVGPALQWATIRVTYANGGEKVDWDE